MSEQRIVWFSAAGERPVGGGGNTVWVRPAVRCGTCGAEIEPEESGPTRYGWRHVSGRAADWNHDPELTEENQQ